MEEINEKAARAVAAGRAETTPDDANRLARAQGMVNENVNRWKAKNLGGAP